MSGSSLFSTRIRRRAPSQLLNMKLAKDAAGNCLLIALCSCASEMHSVLRRAIYRSFLDVWGLIKFTPILSHHCFLLLWCCASHVARSGKVRFVSFLHLLHNVFMALLPDFLKRQPSELRITRPAKVPTCQSFHRDPLFFS